MQAIGRQAVRVLAAKAVYENCIEVRYWAFGGAGVVNWSVCIPWVAMEFIWVGEASGLVKQPILDHMSLGGHHQVGKAVKSAVGMVRLDGARMNGHKRLQKEKGTWNGGICTA